MIFGPKPGGDGLLDIFQGLLLIPPLGDTAGERRTCFMDYMVIIEAYLNEGYFKSPFSKGGFRRIIRQLLIPPAPL